MRVISYLRVSELDGAIRSFLHLGEDVRFVVPSRRDRNWWRERAGRDEFGLDGPPEDILWNWQDLYDNVCGFCEARRLRPIEPPDHRLILSRLLRALLEEDPELLTLWPGLGRAGFLDILSEDIRELLNEAVLPEQTEVGLREADPTARVLPAIYRRYLDYLSANGLMDSAQVCTMTLELLEREPLPWGEDLTMVFTGFLSFTQAQVRLIKKLNDLCREVVVLKPETGLSDFHDAAHQLEGLVWEESPQGVPGRILQIRTRESELEAEAAACMLALWSAERGPLAEEMDFPGFGAIGMMSPAGDEELVIEALGRYSIPYAASEGPLIEQTLPGRSLSAVWSLWVQGLPTYETALFLVQPCLAGDAFSVSEALRAGPSGLAAWRAFVGEGEEKGETPEGPRDEKPRHALAVLSATERLCGALQRGGTPSDLMGSFHRFLTRKGLWLDRMKTLPLSYPELDGAIRATASAIESVHEKYLALRELLPDIGPAGRTPLKGDDAVEFLLSWCRQTRIRPEPPLSGALTLYLGAPPVLASHPVWVMLGVSQGNWPGRISGSPLLGPSERERLAEAEAWLPSVQDKHLQKEALFRRLIRTGESLTILSRADTDENGRPVPDTPFLDRFMADMNADVEADMKADIEADMKADAKADANGWTLKELPTAGVDILLPDSGHIFLEVDADPLVTAPHPAVSVGGNGENGGIEPQNAPPALAVSDLQTLLECPLRYWLQRRAGLRERSLELATAAEWGSLTHKFWERVWRRFGGGGEPFPEAVEEEWRSLSSTDEDYGAFERLIRDRRLARALEVLRFRIRRLAALQAHILERLGQSGFRHRVVLLEDDAALSLEVDGVRFTGRCDRVEILEDGDGRAHAVITDYKAGRSVRYEEGMKDLERYPWYEGGPSKLIRGLQLSAYALMYGPREADAPLAGVNFLGHRDGGIAGTFSAALQGVYAGVLTGETRNNRRTLDERREEAGCAMTCAARLLKEGRFAPFYDSPSCRYCDMKSICRRGEIIGEPLANEEESADE